MANPTEESPVDEEERERRLQALEFILAAEPMEVPADPADIRRELDEYRGRWPRDKSVTVKRPDVPTRLS
jgi:hypothetical protein